MKEKDRWFFKALDHLQSQGINPVAAAHWRNPQLRAVPGFCERKLLGWRAWFAERWPKDLEIGGPE